MTEGQGAGLHVEEGRVGDWMSTFTGKRYFPIDPRVEEVDIIDIAVSLGNQCRYGGHTNRFYSVAEHSVLVSHLVPPEDALAGLLHDATEAYVSDIIRPLKRCLGKGNPLEIVEQKNYEVIAKAFGLPEKLPESVHYADNQILILEKEALMPRSGEWDLPYPRPDNPMVSIKCYDPYNAAVHFLFRYSQLRKFPEDLRFYAFKAALLQLDFYLGRGENIGS